MKTSNFVPSFNNQNEAKDILFKFYLKSQSKSDKTNDRYNSLDLSNHDDKKGKKLKPSAMKKCFSKWRSFWKLKTCSEIVNENATEPVFSDLGKPDPPKSLPLTRRCDQINYGPLINGSHEKDKCFHRTRISSDKRTENFAISFIGSPPPLPLRKDVSKVVITEQSIMTKTTETVQKCHSRISKYNHLIENFKKLKQVPWYWGPLTKYEAELLLMNKEDGVFLVRDSGHEAYVLSVSFRASHRTYHTRVEHSSGNFSFWLNDHNAVKAANIVDFINQLIEESKSGHVRYLISDNHLNDEIMGIHHQIDNSRISVALLSPFSRFQVVQSLAHLCRFQILLRIRRDLIGELRIPNFLKRYLQSPQYFVERIESYL